MIEAGKTTRPDFLVIGAMKCATSTVCAYLEDHPDVYMMPGAEPDFFSHDTNWEKGPDWYEKFFEGGSSHRLRGEGSNSYTNLARFPDTAARIRSYCPDARLIYMVRHPLRRVLSDWIQRRAQDRAACPATPDAAVREAPEIFVDPSLYWRQLEAFRHHMPDERIFIGLVEDLRTDPDAFFKGLCAFLGIPPAPQIARPHANPSEGKRVPSRLYALAKSFPGARTLRGLLPDTVASRLVERHLLTDVTDAARFSPTVRDRLAAQIAPDAERFLTHVGRPVDTWDLSSV